MGEEIWTGRTGIGIGEMVIRISFSAGARPCHACSSHGHHKTLEQHDNAPLKTRRRPSRKHRRR